MSYAIALLWVVVCTFKWGAIFGSQGLLFISLYSQPRIEKGRSSGCYALDFLANQHKIGERVARDSMRRREPNISHVHLDWYPLSVLQYKGTPMTWDAWLSVVRKFEGENECQAENFQPNEGKSTHWVYTNMSEHLLLLLGIELMFKNIKSSGNEIGCYSDPHQNCKLRFGVPMLRWAFQKTNSVGCAGEPAEAHDHIPDDRWYLRLNFNTRERDSL